MKKYDVTLRGHYEKTISVYADSPEEAKKKTEIVLFDTDLIDFTDDDFVCGEADITESLTDGCEDNEDEDACLEYEDCSECPYFCPVCGECVYEDECEDYVLPSTEFGYPDCRLETNSLVGGCP